MRRQTNLPSSGQAPEPSPTKPPSHKALGVHVTPPTSAAPTSEPQVIEVSSTARGTVYDDSFAPRERVVMAAIAFSAACWLLGCAIWAVDAGVRSERPDQFGGDALFWIIPGGIALIGIVTGWNFLRRSRR